MKILPLRRYHNVKFVIEGVDQQMFYYIFKHLNGDRYQLWGWREDRPDNMTKCLVYNDEFITRSLKCGWNQVYD